jgi:hypothetical protein
MFGNVALCRDEAAVGGGGEGVTAVSGGRVGLLLPQSPFEPAPPAAADEGLFDDDGNEADDEEYKYQCDNFEKYHRTSTVCMLLISMPCLGTGEAGMGDTL